METTLKSKIQYLKGVGPRRAELFANLGVHTVEDLLFHFPSRCEDRSNFREMTDLDPGETAVIRGRVSSVRDFGRNWKRGFRVTLTDGQTKLTGTWFRAYFLKERFKRGQEVVFSGTVGLYKDELTMSHPDFEILGEEGEITSLSIDRIVPIHPATEGLTQAIIRRLVHQALEQFGDELVEWLPPSLVKAHQLPHPTVAVRQAHFPDDEDGRARATGRFKYEELLLLQVLMALRRQKARASAKSVAFTMWPKLNERIHNRIPFTLTGAQERAIADIVADMTSPLPMNRLLEGDVGSGKTIVAVYALLTAIANKAQAAFMAPTEVLAEQHYLTLTRLLEGSRVRVLLLEGGLTGRKRRDALGRVAAGDVDLVVGTHALIQKDVGFQKLGLVVVDEQHKFGVAQRATILEKGSNPDFLIMTATPIPRTLSLTFFGDLDTSVIDEMPPGRTPPETRWIRAKREQKKALRAIREELSQGRQAFFVYPVIEESEALDVKALEGEAEKLASEVFPDFTVALLHGQMKRQDKEGVMDRFRAGEVHVLASTTVIEVGVDVPNATVMVVENAERFGLAQLHQLRGRIGRGGGASYCYLFGKAATDDAKARLAAIETLTDGFRIAEEDLRIRGPGDFFGTRQHGLPMLRFVNLVEDLDLLRLARSDAFGLVEADPAMARPEHRRVLERLVERFGEHFDVAGIG